MPSLPETYKSAIFQKANDDLTIVESKLILPTRGEVLVKVLATGLYLSGR